MFHGPRWEALAVCNMPCGVCFASEVCQEGVEPIIGVDLLWKYIMLYIDDLLAKTRTYRAHVYLFRSLFLRLRARRVRLAADKGSYL